jgi:hypothetical protein
LAVVRIQVVYPVRKRNRLFCYVVKTQLWTGSIVHVISLLWSRVWHPRATARSEDVQWMSNDRRFLHLICRMYNRPSLSSHLRASGNAAPSTAYAASARM